MQGKSAVVQEQAAPTTAEPASQPSEPSAESPRPADPPSQPVAATRSKLQEALARAEAARLKSKGSKTTKQDVILTGREIEALQIQNKTGSTSEWEKRQLGILSELLAECYDLAKETQPDLRGTIGIRFTVAAEPELGGLVDDVEFNEEYSSIEDPSMRECMQESLYALELEPPPEGIKVGRELTLRFDEEPG